MNQFKKNYKKILLVLIFFIFYSFILFFPKTSFAIVGPIIHMTERNEPITLGKCWIKCCDPACATICIQCTCKGEWTEYKADTKNCESTIEKRRCRSVCGSATACCTCGKCRVECDLWEKTRQCESWQVSKIGKGTREIRRTNSTRSGLEEPECYCLGECIETPRNPRYFGNPNFPTCIANPEPKKNERYKKHEIQNPNNIFLPVKLNADNVPGWHNNWVAEQKIKECSKEDKQRDECIRVYQITIKGKMRDRKVLEELKRLKTRREDYLARGKGAEAYEIKKEMKRLRKEELMIDKYRITLEFKEDAEDKIKRIIKKERLIEEHKKSADKLEFIPFFPCFFKSGQKYEWKIRGCCDNPNTFESHVYCGEWTKWQKFTTNPTPEPFAPRNIVNNNIQTWGDPDWAGKQKAENQPLDVVLDWCETNFVDDPVSFTYSYKLKLFEVQYQNEKYEYVCHRYLKDPRTGKCIPKILNTQREPYRKFFIDHPPFFNKIYDYFIKNNIYAWQVAVCTDTTRIRCTNFGQKWRFQTTKELERPTLSSPPNDPEGIIPVGLPTILSWKDKPGDRSHTYEIYKYLKGHWRPVREHSTFIHNINLDYPSPLMLNTLYRWRVKPCWGEGFIEEHKCGKWGDWWYFKTTGRPPKPESMKPTNTNIVIPTSFEWEDVPGAKSYVFVIWGGNLEKEEKELIIRANQRPTIEFPYLHPETTYHWRVRSCPRIDGSSYASNRWSAIQTFTTFKIQSPSNLKPKGPLFVDDHHPLFSWTSAAKYHEFKLTYTKEKGEEREKCLALENGKTKIVIGNSLFFPLECRGKYQWKVRSCLDEVCTKAGASEWSVLQNITLATRIAPKELRVGLVPCGRKFDNPATPWVETDHCEIRHIFIMFYLILNFFLWTIIPLILVILVAITGVMFYFSISTETPDPISKAKTIWKAAGIGFGVIFLAWNIVCFILTLFGYQVGIFGLWWQI
jgi:hypothetical protein